MYLGIDPGTSEVKILRPVLSRATASLCVLEIKGMTSRDFRRHAGTRFGS